MPEVSKDFVATLVPLIDAGRTVCVTFIDDGDNEEYEIQWEELLDQDEVPFISFESVLEAEKLMAPYKTGRKSGVNYAEAKLVLTRGVDTDSGEFLHSKLVLSGMLFTLCYHHILFTIMTANIGKLL